MLYDTTADVIRKALRGLDLAPSSAARRAGLDEREVLAASRGPATADTLAKLAPALSLGPGALAALPGYAPPCPDLPEITRIELPFDGETVNAWLLDAGEGLHLLFDTGDGPDDARRALEQLGVTPAEVLITHQHGDHTGGLRGLGDRIRRLSGPGQPEPLQPGDVLKRGRLSIRVIGLPGHCAGALGYAVEGLARPVCVTGDALFAGSIGGCAPGEPYREAISAIRSRILTLPGDTVLLPGHGPPSNVSSEIFANPFLSGA